MDRVSFHRMARPLGRENLIYKLYKQIDCGDEGCSGNAFKMEFKSNYQFQVNFTCNISQ